VVPTPAPVLASDFRLLLGVAPRSVDPIQNFLSDLTQNAPRRKPVAPRALAAPSVAPPAVPTAAAPFDFRAELARETAAWKRAHPSEEFTMDKLMQSMALAPAGEALGTLLSSLFIILS
jgi:hypothetical protein